MTIIGRLTKDATLNQVPDNRKVVNFSMAVNDRYTTRGEKVAATTYFHCAYWQDAGIAPYLKKGTLVQVEGRVYASIYTNAAGEAKAALNCHVNNLQLHGGPKEVKIIGRPAETLGGGKDEADDLPF